MVAESSKNLNSELNNVELSQLFDWLRTLQQALTLEAESDFNNLLGRDEHFNSFLFRQFSCPPKNLHSQQIKECLSKFSRLYEKYPSLDINARKRLVIDSRQTLQKLKREFSPPLQKSLPKIKFKKYNHKTDSGDINFDDLISVLNGVGSKIAERLSVLGIFTIRDLLFHYPRDYVDYSSLRHIKQLEVGETATIIASVRKSNAFNSPRNKNLSILELHLFDSTGRFKVTRFFAGRRYSNQGYLRGQVSLYPKGTTVAVSGLVKSGPYGKFFQDPFIEVLESSNSTIKSRSIGQLLPVYSLTEGISADRFRGLIDLALPLIEKFPDPIPDSILDKLSLPKKNIALTEIHKPQSQQSLKEAKRRLVFDEFFILQLGLLRRRYELSKRSAPLLKLCWEPEGLVGKFLKLLPFNLTNAQKNVLSEVESDLGSSEPMARLIQGDVGSGKTVVAIAALLNAVQAGWQGAFMAPTEVLAVQHYRTLCKWLLPLHVTVELLTGSTRSSRRREILDNLSNGTLKILVGTHALIEDKVSFCRLGLVIVDEQHRFGVHQRNRLLSKGLQPHLLTMTATPIPRTLALSLHGDLDVSQIHELPPGRTPIKTSLIANHSRDKAYNLIREEVLKGHQAYVVLPLIEESEKLDLRSAVEVHKHLKEEIFSEFEVSLLHGRMSSAEKKEVIENLVLGKCQILVSTTVVEVGVDVPNATVMLIDHADRFGLAQLHQLRGRVGRGAKNSHCLLVNDSKNPLAKQRLEVLVNSNDGFEISEIDLRFRGPGQILGTRQSGLPDFALASLVEDADVLEQAREEAKCLLKVDPELTNYKALANILNDQWKRLSDGAHLN